MVDAYYQAEYPYTIEIRDDDPIKKDGKLNEIEITCPVGEPMTWPKYVHIAIGSNSTRKKLALKAINVGCLVLSIIHPRANVARDAVIGTGTFVAANSIIGPTSVLGIGVIVNHGAIVDHECDIGDWSHIAPGSVLGGGCEVGKECLIGSGATILPGVKVGDEAVVGSGAVVTKDVPKGATVLGNPAKEMRGNARGLN